MSTATVATLPGQSIRNKASEALGRIGALAREIRAKEDAIAERVVLITAEIAPDLDEMKKSLEAELRKLVTIAKRDEAKLLAGCDGQTLTLPEGTLSFYSGPMGVECDEEDEAALVEKLEAADIADGVRVVKGLDREYLIEHREEINIAGLEFQQGRFVGIKPEGEKGWNRKLGMIVFE